MLLSSGTLPDMYVELVDFLRYYELSFPRKRESIKIKELDSPIAPGNDKKMNNEWFSK